MGRCSKALVQYDSNGILTLDVPDGETRIVGEYGPHADENRVTLIPHSVGFASCLLSGDPFGVTGSGRDLAVESHGGLQRDEWKPRADVFGEIDDQRRALSFQHAELDVDALRGQSLDGARHVRRGVATPDDDPRDACLEDRLRAWTVRPWWLQGSSVTNRVAPSTEPSAFRMASTSAWA